MTAGTICELVKLRKELLYQKRFPLKLTATVYKSDVCEANSFVQE